MSKIKLTDTTLEVLIKMSDGNPGAAMVLSNILTPESEAIDPDAYIGGMSKIFTLDTLGIYGTDIYVLHNDICNRDMVKMYAVLRAFQLGYLNGDVLKDACSRQDRSGKEMIDVEGLYKKVSEYLPNFNNKHPQDNEV